jgi:hypothetical protein
MINSIETMRSVLFTRPYQNIELTRVFLELGYIIYLIVDEQPARLEATMLDELLPLDVSRLFRSKLVYGFNRVSLSHELGLAQNLLFYPCVLLLGEP